MAGKYNPTVVGTDAFFREICIGDEIQDLDGRHYTVDKYGRCKPLDGGNIVPLSSVKEAALVSRYEGPPIDVTERKPAAPKPEKKPEPKTEPAIVQGTVSPRGGRSNRSGMTSFWNLSRSVGVPAAQLKEIAQEHGFEIVRANGVNRNTGIRIEDVYRLRSLLPERPAQEQKPAAPPKEKPAKTSKANCGDLAVSPVLEAKGIEDDDIVKAVEEHGLWLRCLDECPCFSDTLLHNVLTRRGFYGTTNLDALPGFNPAETLVTNAVDKMLADELRSRGYAVTAIKHVEL